MNIAVFEKLKNGDDRAVRFAVAALLIFGTLCSLATVNLFGLNISSLVFLFTLVGAVAGWRVAQRSYNTEPMWRLAWSLIALSFVARAISYAAVLLMSRQFSLPAITLRNLGSSALTVQPLLLWLGLLFMARVPSVTEKLSRAIDSLLIGGSVAALIWWLCIEPILQGAGANTIAYVSWARPFTAVGNTVAFALAVLHALRAKQGVAGYWLMAVTLAALATADFLFFWNLKGISPIPSALLSGACPLLLIVAARWQLTYARSEHIMAMRSRAERLANEKPEAPVESLPAENDSPDNATGSQDNAKNGEILEEENPSQKLSGRIGSGNRTKKWAFPSGTDELSRFEESRHELSLHWMTGALVVVLPALATLTGIYHILSTRDAHANTRIIPGELWWAPLLVCLAALRHTVVSLRSTNAMGNLLAHASSLQETVEARTHLLSAFHTTTASLNNTLNQEQTLTIALERMLDAVRGDAGAIWLRTDFEVLSSHAGDTRGQGELQQAASLGAITNKAFLRRHSEQQAARRNVELQAGAILNSVEGIGDNERTTPAARWKLVRSQGYASEAQQQALCLMHEALEHGGVTECSHLCTTQMGKLGSAHASAIRWKGEVLGAVSVACWQDDISSAERKLLDSLALELGATLQNAYLYQDARRRADLDGVTDLFNHRTIQEHLHDSLKDASKKNESLTIVMMDLNNFKFFNDTYGHPVGDKVLRIVARCLRETCRTNDVIGRYGGDEFIALLPETDAHGALEVCSRIAARVEEEAYQDAEGRRIPIGLSFGAAVYPGDGDVAHDLLSIADANLYEAKRGGAPAASQRGAAEEAEELRQIKEVGPGGSFAILDALVTAIDNKDHYTRSHSEDVTHWATLMARELDYSSDTQRAVRICGLLHDVGKIAVPDSILGKTGRLNDDEFQTMQQHPVFGALIVKDVPNLSDVLGGIRHHHERFDGKGYPDKLKGEAIPLLGRLLAVPDCFSAMTTERPYRKALSWSEALSEIEKRRGTQFDPAMVSAFLNVIAHIVADDHNQSFDKNGGRHSVLQLAGTGADAAENGTGNSESRAEIVVRPRSVADVEASAT